MKTVPKIRKAALRPRAALPGKRKNRVEGRQGKSLPAKGTSRDVHDREVRLFADLANEIRPPLINVLGMNRSLLETNLSAEQRDYIQKARASAESLLTVFNDILDYPKIKAGKLTLEKIDFDLRTAIEDTVHRLAHQARQKGLELAWLIHHDVPSLLSGDPGRLRQILINLIQQALRYTEKGEILIHVTLEGESKTQATVHFAVMDTGRGIPKGRRSALFQFSPRRDSAGMKKWSALEIGLAISRKLVGMMGGQIGVESRKGQGSTFWFTAVLGKQKAEKKGPRITTENIEGQSILIVDERSPSRQTLREQLRAWGCLPEEAVGIKETLAKLHQAEEKKIPYSLVILNKEMKEIDGITLGRHIKEDPELSSTILVLLTSQGNRGDGKLVQDIGFAAYLTKPIMSSQLRDCLALAMGRRTLPADSAGAPLITRYSLAEEKKRRTRILLAEDDVKIQEVGLQILQKIGYRGDVAANGKKVLSALERAPYDLILMDVEMPVMDGFRATTAIRQKEKNTRKHIPVIGMTARATEGDRERCLEAGMDDYIPKPIQAIDVVDALDRFLSEADSEMIA